MQINKIVGNDLDKRTVGAHGVEADAAEKPPTFEGDQTVVEIRCGMTGKTQMSGEALAEIAIIDAGQLQLQPLGNHAPATRRKEAFGQAELMVE